MLRLLPKFRRLKSGHSASLSHDVFNHEVKQDKEPYFCFLSDGLCFVLIGLSGLTVRQVSRSLKKKKSNKNISPAREMGIALPRLKEKEYEQYFCMSNHVCDKSVLPVFAVFDVRAE